MGISAPSGHAVLLTQSTSRGAGFGGGVCAIRTELEKVKHAESRRVRITSIESLLISGYLLFLVCIIDDVWYVD